MGKSVEAKELVSIRTCTPCATKSRISATPSFPGTKYAEMMTSSCFADFIRAVILLAIVTSSSGEVSLAIFAGPSASTVAGTQVSLTVCASSSRASHRAPKDASGSTSGSAASSVSTPDESAAIGMAYLLFQNASNDADKAGTMGPAATTSRSTKLLRGSKVKY